MVFYFFSFLILPLFGGYQDINVSKCSIMDGYTRKGKRTVKTRRLIDSVCGRMKRAVPYASLAVSKGVSR